jgi:hypothetical protein
MVQQIMKSILSKHHLAAWLGIPIFGSDFWDPLGSGIPIPFSIPKIPVGKFSQIPLLTN